MRDSILRERMNWDDEIQDRQLFANRSFEIGRVEQKIDEAQSKQVAHPVTEFHAVTGQGKTWLLRHFYLKFQREADQWSPKRTLTARVTFEDLPKETWFHQAANVLEDLAQQISTQVSEPIELPKMPSGRAPSPRELEKQSRALIDGLGKLTERYVPILIFDGAEHADDDLFDWLEEHLFYLLVSRQQTLFIFGSRRELYWKLYDVRRRVDSYLLEPFSPPNADAQLSKRESGDRAGKLLSPYSAGHPETNLLIAEAFRKERGIGELTVEALASNQDLIKDTVAVVIRTKFLAGLKPETQQFVWDICILRKFHTEYIRFMALRRDERYAEKGEGYFLDAIRELIDNALAEWNSERGGYVLDATVRQIMIKNLEMREPLQFAEMENHAVEFYTYWMKRVPESTPGYLLELLYHQTELQRLNRLISEEILADLKQALAKCPETLLPQLSERFDEDAVLLQGMEPSLKDSIRAQINQAIAHRNSGKCQ